MKKKLLLVVLLIACTLCFAEKWKKKVMYDSWGEVTGFDWSTIAQIVNTSSRGEDCMCIGVTYIKSNDGETGFVFGAGFEYIAPYAYSGYMEVKDGPRVKAYVERKGDSLGFLILLLTLEEYRRFYEGKLVQLQWGNGEYITIKAPIWEE